MVMTRSRIAAAAAAAIALASLGTGIALAASSAGPAPQLNNPDVYACVNQAGQIDYLEFRLPIPHLCWFASESLWRWSVNPVPAPTVTATSG